MANDFVSLSALAREIDAIERIQAECATIATRSDDARRHDLVRLRRELASQIMRLSQVAEPIFLEAGGDLLRDYRAKFGRMRSAAAAHQANWPAVGLVNENMSEYRAGAQNLNEADRDFTTWVRKALAQLRR